MFRFLVVSCIVFSLTIPARGETLPGPIEAEVIRIVDGDTIKVRATIWVDQTVEVSVRLRGIDAPEIYRPKCEAEKALARTAKQLVAAAAPVGSQVLISDISRDKYGGRVVANILISDGETLAERLLAQDQAIPDGAPKPWCGAS
ncbi:MAG: thermonuclease family protein [Pseudomonadota bacterium]